VVIIALPTFKKTYKFHVQQMTQFQIVTTLEIERQAVLQVTNRLDAEILDLQMDELQITDS